jgi:hypothetical protein
MLETSSTDLRLSTLQIEMLFDAYVFAVRKLMLSVVAWQPGIRSPAVAYEKKEDGVRTDWRTTLSMALGMG